MVSERKMQDLAQEILDTLKKVDNGDASLEEVESLYKNSRGLYERAILLKTKAFSNNSLPSSIVKEQPKEETATAPETAQAQEEQSEATQPSGKAIHEEKEKEASKDMPLFDFTDMGEEETQEEESEPQQEAKQETAETPQPEETTATTEASASVNDHQNIIDSINDAYKHAEDNSLLEDMKKKPITDLKTAIGINDKFSYINDLFNGENQLYEVAISQLEALQSADEAKHKLSELAIDNEWDLESKTVMQFVELVERRYATLD